MEQITNFFYLAGQQSVQLMQVLRPAQQHTADGHSGRAAGEHGAAFSS